MIRPTARVVGFAIIGVAALFASAITRRPEPAVVAAPFLTLGLVAMVALRPPQVAAAVAVEPARLLQGEQVRLSLTLATRGGTGRVRVELDVPAGLRLDEGERCTELVVSTRLTSVTWMFTAVEWGATRSVRLQVTVTDLIGAYEQRAELTSGVLRVLPREERLRGIIPPRALRSISGAHLSRQRGDGIEFADTREFAAGDRARDVNWRVSARRQELWVDDRRPERSGEVVVFLDTFATVGDTIDNTLRRTVEVAAAITDRHISANDRVGLVDLGGVLRWVRPGGGTVQLYRIAETLVETEAWASGADKTVDVLPARALPRRCLVVAVTPLIDARGVEAIRTLRARGFDVAVIEVAPQGFLSPQSDARSELAHRLWELERHAVRTDLRHQGIAVGEWLPGEPLGPVLDAIGVFRTAVLRSAR
jgi:uncharacterized protein (DUF58 family)